MIVLTYEYPPTGQQKLAQTQAELNRVYEGADFLVYLRVQMLLKHMCVSYCELFVARVADLIRLLLI